MKGCNKIYSHHKNAYPNGTENEILVFDFY